MFPLFPSFICLENGHPAQELQGLWFYDFRVHPDTLLLPVPVKQTWKQSSWWLAIYLPEPTWTVLLHWATKSSNYLCSPLWKKKKDPELTKHWSHSFFLHTDLSGKDWFVKSNTSSVQRRKLLWCMSSLSVRRVLQLLGNLLWRETRSSPSYEQEHAHIPARISTPPADWQNSTCLCVFLCILEENNSFCVCVCVWKLAWFH